MAGLNSMWAIKIRPLRDLEFFNFVLLLEQVILAYLF
jgi:hypothetical protein